MIQNVSLRAGRALPDLADWISELIQLLGGGPDDEVLPQDKHYELAYLGVYQLFELMTASKEAGVGELAWDKPSGITSRIIDLPAYEPDKPVDREALAASGGKPVEEIIDGLAELRGRLVISRGVFFIHAPDEGSIVVPQNTFNRLERLPEDQRQKRVGKLIEGRLFREPFATRTEPLEVTDARTGRKRAAWGAVLVYYQPPLIEIEKGPGPGRAILTTRLKLDIRGLQPDRWTEEDRQRVKDHILRTLKDKVRQQDLGFMGDLGGGLWKKEEEAAPQVQVPVLVKTSRHLQSQFPARSTGGDQLSILDLLPPGTRERVRKEAEEHRVEVVGIEPTQSLQQAIFAIQKLLNKTDYRGNLDGKDCRGNNPFHFTGHLPGIDFSMPEYLDAYGVSKVPTARGRMEYSTSGRREALKALERLANEKVIFFYEKHYQKDGKPVVDLVSDVDTLVKIIYGWEALSPEEAEMVKSGGSTEATKRKLRIAIRPHVIFVDQIDRFFILKPANYLQEIKVKYPKAGKYQYAFIEYLWAEASNRGGKHTDWIIEINYLKLAKKLRMDGLINTRNWKRIRETLDKCYEMAEGLGYILGHETVPGAVVEEKEVIYLNPGKFRAALPGEKKGSA